MMLFYLLLSLLIGFLLLHLLVFLILLLLQLLPLLFLLGVHLFLLLLVFLIALGVPGIRRRRALRLRNIFRMNYVVVAGAWDIVILRPIVIVRPSNVIILRAVIVIAIRRWIVSSACCRSVHDCAIFEHRWFRSRCYIRSAAVCRRALLRI